MVLYMVILVFLWTLRDLNTGSKKKYVLLAAVILLLISAGSLLFSVRLEPSINPSLTQLGDAYIRRCKSVWSEPALCEWAEATASRLITEGLQMDNLTKMKKLFTGVPPLAIDRHFVIFRDVMAPNGEENGDFKSYWDPFPPPVGKVKYRLKQHGREARPRQVQPYHSATLAFLHSLSPCYDIVDEDQD